MQRPLRDHLALEARLTFETGAVFTCRPTQNSVSSNIHCISTPEIILSLEICSANARGNPSDFQ